jgi:hypothetical protein
MRCAIACHRWEWRARIKRKCWLVSEKRLPDPAAVHFDVNGVIRQKWLLITLRYQVEAIGLRLKISSHSVARMSAIPKRRGEVN